VQQRVASAKCAGHRPQAMAIRTSAGLPDGLERTAGDVQGKRMRCARTRCP